MLNETTMANRFKEFPKRGERPDFDELIGNVGCWIYNRAQGRYWCSEEIARIFEMDCDRFLSIEEYVKLIHPDDRDAYIRYIREAVQEGSMVYTYRLMIGGREKWIQERIRVFGGEQDIMLVAVLHEITDIRREQSNALQDQQELAAITDYLAETVDTTDVTALVERAKRTIQRVLRVNMIGVFIREQSGILRILTTEEQDRGVFDRQPDSDYIAYQTLRAGRTFIRRVGEYPNPAARHMLESRGVRKLISVPITAHGRTIAAMTLALTEDRDLDDGERSFCRTICGHLAAQLRNAMLYRQLQKELTDRKRLESDLDAIFTESIDFISIIGPDGYFRRINPTFARRLEYSEQELYSRSILDLLHPDDREEGERSLHEVIETGTVRAGCQRYICKSGKILYLEMNARYVRSGDKIIAIARDVTIQRRVEEEKAVLQRSMEMEKLRTEFFSNLSHEFKTPIHIILSSVQLLDKKMQWDQVENRGKYGKLCRYIEQNAYRILRLTTNLLDSTRIESGHLPLSLGWGDIVDRVHGIVQSVNPYAASKKIRLRFSAHLYYSPRILFDRDKLERILLNLLSNAIKNTPENGLIVVRVEDTADEVVIQVSDSGQGIPQELLPYIFDKFRTADTGMVRHCEGSGLGLSIVRALVQMHGGDIVALSPSGEGCTFRFTLSRKLTSARAGEAERIPEDSVVGMRVRMEMADVE